MDEDESNSFNDAKSQLEKELGDMDTELKKGGDSEEVRQTQLQLLRVLSADLSSL
jgi:hypothetical protein